MFAVKCVLYTLLVKLRVSVASLEDQWDRNGPDISNRVVRRTNVKERQSQNVQILYTRNAKNTFKPITWTDATGHSIPACIQVTGSRVCWDRYRLVLRVGIFLLLAAVTGFDVALSNTSSCVLL